MRTTTNNKYPDGYKSKIVYWTNKFIGAKNLEETKLANEKINYFKQRQQELELANAMEPTTPKKKGYTPKIEYWTNKLANANEPWDRVNAINKLQWFIERQKDFEIIQLEPTSSKRQQKANELYSKRNKYLF
jgi:hypothetical protein